MSELITLDSIMGKPLGCASCPYSGTGRGFCSDWVPKSPKVAFLARDPGENEIVEGMPLVGPSGRLLVRVLIEQLGYTRSDVLLANILHCATPNANYPTGLLKTQSEKYCRQYWKESLDKYQPNHIVIAYHPAFILRNWSSMRVMQNDIAKAFRLASKGRRVLVCMGDDARARVLPNQLGNVSKWRGHHQPLDWSQVQ